MDCSTPGSLSITNSRSLLRFMSIESVMPSNHLILCHPLFLPTSIFPSIRVFSNESVLRIRWPKYWSFSLSIRSFAIMEYVKSVFFSEILVIHFTGDSCNHWMYFSDATKTKNGWANELLHEFECNVEMLKQAVKDHNVGSPPKSPTHASPQHTQTGILPITTLCHSPSINCVCVCICVNVYVHHMIFSVNKNCVCCCCCCCVASVVSDSVRPHRWQPTRLPRPWGSPGKNTGVGCHFLLQCIKVKSESKVAQSCLTLSDPVYSVVFN